MGARKKEPEQSEPLVVTVVKGLGNPNVPREEWGTWHEVAWTEYSWEELKAYGLRQETGRARPREPARGGTNEVPVQKEPLVVTAKRGQVDPNMPEGARGTRHEVLWTELSREELKAYWRRHGMGEMLDEDCDDYYKGRAALGEAKVKAPVPAPAPAPVLVQGASVQAQAVSWLWPGYLLAGKLNILAGAPGGGKTAVALALAAAVSRGGAWPGGGAAPRGDVLVWSRGDGLRDLLLPRFLACGGDAGRVYFVDGEDGRGGDADQGEGARGFDAERDVPALREALREGRAWKLLVVDGLAASRAVGRGALVASLKALAQLAHESGCAVLGVVDCRPVGGRDTAGRLVEAIGGAAQARMLLHAARCGDSGGAGVLTRMRSRFGPDGDGFEYRLDWAEPPGGIGATRVVWGGPLAGPTQRIIEQAKEDPLVAAFSERSAGVRAEAMEFLQALLAQGPVPVSRLRKDVDGAGHSWRTVRRAKHALGVRADKCSISGTWSWSLGPGGGAETSPW